MAKTYNTLSNVTVGSVLTASDYNEAVENSNNYRVPPMAKAYSTANTTLTNGQWVKIPVASKLYDTDSMHDSANSRIKIGTAGVYAFHASLFADSNDTGGPFRIFALMKNATVSGGNFTAGVPIAMQSNALVEFLRMSLSGIDHMAANDYVELYFFWQSGTNRSTGTAPTLTISGDRVTDTSSRTSPYISLAASWLGQVS
jgi:hypothetical protein